MSTMNLLPQDYLQRRWQQRPNVICMVLFGVVVASIGGAALVTERNQRTTREVCERINAAYGDAAKLIDEVHQLEAQKHRMLEKAKRSAALMERLPRSYVLAMLANALPEGASLCSLQMTVGAVRSNLGEAKTAKTKHAMVASARLKEPDPTGPALAVVLTIKGKASTDVQVARFIANLAKHPLTEMVDLSYSKEAQGKSPLAREFQLTVRLRPNADALDGMRRPQEEDPPPGPPGPTQTGEEA